MLRDAPRRRRVALLIRGPTSLNLAYRLWVPASREAALHAASHPGHEKIAVDNILRTRGDLSFVPICRNRRHSGMRG